MSFDLVWISEILILTHIMLVLQSKFSAVRRRIMTYSRIIASTYFVYVHYKMREKFIQLETWRQLKCCGVGSKLTSIIHEFFFWLSVFFGVAFLFEYYKSISKEWNEQLMR